METMLNFNAPITWLFYITVLTGISLVTFANNAKMLLGIFVLLMSTWILHSNEQKAADIQFVYEQFESRHMIECGLWRGNNTIANPASGWVLQEGRFVKNDIALSDPSLCSVPDKEFPQISWFEYLILFLVITGLALLGRLGMRKQERRSYWSGTRKAEASENAASDAAQGE